MSGVPSMPRPCSYNSVIGYRRCFLPCSPLSLHLLQSVQRVMQHYVLLMANLLLSQSPQAGSARTVLTLHHFCSGWRAHDSSSQLRLMAKQHATGAHILSSIYSYHLEIL